MNKNNITDPDLSVHFDQLSREIDHIESNPVILSQFILEYSP